MSLKGMEYTGESAVYYDYVATGVEGDVPFYVEEARSAGSPVLELGCGTGRILIPMAAAGLEVVGLDASHDMLMIARNKLEVLPPEVRRRVQLVEGDMRRLIRGCKILPPAPGRCQRTGAESSCIHEVW